MIERKRVRVVFCPECGAQVDGSAAACPNGHKVRSIIAVTAMAASAARTIGVSARPALSLRVPSVEEAWPVVMGLKVLGMATLVAGVVTWRIAAQLLAGVGAPTILGSVFALGAFAAGFALYALALLVQAAVGSAHGRGEARR
jgi:hypothetical protein